MLFEYLSTGLLKRNVLKGRDRGQEGYSYAHAKHLRFTATIFCRTV